MNVHFQLDGERFTWDLEKALSNIEKHGISFEVAAEVLVDPLLTFVDANVDEENREAAIGVTFARAVLYVVNIETLDGETRIISARAATDRERRLYEDRA